MDNPYENVDVRTLRWMIWLVWAALLFSVVIYGVVIVLIPPPEHFTPSKIASGNPPNILIILGLATITLAPIIRNLRHKMFFDPIGEECSPGSPEAKSAYFRMSMTSWGLCEVVAVFGFVIHFLTYKLAFALPFVAAAGILMVVFRPTRQAMDGN